MLWVFEEPPHGQTSIEKNIIFNEIYNSYILTAEKSRYVAWINVRNVHLLVSPQRG